MKSTTRLLLAMLTVFLVSMSFGSLIAEEENDDQEGKKFRGKRFMEDNEEGEGFKKFRKHQGGRDGEEKPEGRNRQGRRGGGKDMKRIMESLTEDEKAELKKLHKEDPEKFRQVLREKIQAHMKKKREEHQQLQEQITKYKKSTDEAAKTDAMAEIRKLVKKQFDEKMARNRQQLEASKKRLENLQKKYDERLGKADKIIEKHIETLIQPEELKW